MLPRRFCAFCLDQNKSELVSSLHGLDFSLWIAIRWVNFNRRDEQAIRVSAQLLGGAPVGLTTLSANFSHYLTQQL